MQLPIRPESNVCIAILKPSPSLPSKFSFDILQSSNIKLPLN